MVEEGKVNVLIWAEEKAERAFAEAGCNGEIEVDRLVCKWIERTDVYEGTDEREARDANRTVFDPYIYVWWMMEGRIKVLKNCAEEKEEVESRSLIRGAREEKKLKKRMFNNI